MLHSNQNTRLHNLQLLFHYQNYGEDSCYAKRKLRFIHTRKRAKRAFNLFMMQARRPRYIPNVWIKRRLLQSLCCCPPESFIDEESSLSFTASHNEASFSACSTMADWSLYRRLRFKIYLLCVSRSTHPPRHVRMVSRSIPFLLICCCRAMHRHIPLRYPVRVQMYHNWNRFPPITRQQAVGNSDCPSPFYQKNSCILQDSAVESSFSCGIVAYGEMDVKPKKFA